MEKFQHRKNVSDTVCHKVNGVPDKRSYQLCKYVQFLQAQVEQLETTLKTKTKDEIHALIEKYGDPQYKTNEFALYDVISIAQQLRMKVIELTKQYSYEQAKTDRLKRSVEHLREDKAELTKELGDKLGELDAECRVSQMLLKGQEKLTKELKQERENNKTFVDWLERRVHAHDHEYFHNDCSLCSYEKEALKQLKKELHIALPKEEGKNETD